MAQSVSHPGHGVGLFGEAAPQEPPEEPTAPLAGYDPIADEHVELARRTGCALDGDTELLPDLGGETRRPGLVASGRAIQDLDLLHARSVSPGIVTGRAEVEWGWSSGLCGH